MDTRFYRPLTAVLAFLLMVAMVLAAIGIGAYRTYSDTREPVDAQRGNLMELVQARAGAARNIATVARRHLPADDPNLTALVTALDAYNASQPMDRQWAQHDAISTAAERVLSALGVQDSVLSDERDLMYVTRMLPESMLKTAQLIDESPYNTAAAAYNDRLNTQFSGWVARLLGIKPFPLFAQGDGV